MMTFNEFIYAYAGKRIDYDGSSGVQCVDLAKLYLDKCFGIKCGTMGNAKDWWLNRKNNSIISKNFDWITINNHRPSATNSIHFGDIGIRTSGKYGHIFICSGTAGKSIVYYDQNGTGNHDAMKLRSKPFTDYYVTGILRKKTEKKKVKANGGLHYYHHIYSDSAGTIPNNTNIEVIVKNAGSKKISNKTYKMAIIWYNNQQVYVAQTYLK